MIQTSTDVVSPISTLNHALFEIIDSKELAQRLRLPESWIRDRVRARSDDPLPHVKIGRYVRFEWASPELVEWWARHRVSKRGRNGGGF
ncbi:MAG: hypothetical protein ACRD22_09725 [Terriglobia bacterium]